MTDQPSFCAYCGTRLDPAWTFCESCGKPVVPAAQAVQAPPPPAPPIPPAPPAQALPASVPARPATENLPWPGYVEPSAPIPPAPAKKKGKTWVIILIVGLALCCCLTAILAFVFRDKWIPTEFTQLLNGTPIAIPFQPGPATAVPAQSLPATAVPAQPVPATAVPAQPVPATAVPVPSGRTSVEYSDDFSRSNNLWNTFDDSDAYSGFHEGGVYAISVRVPNMEIFAYPDLEADRTLDDVTVSVSAYKVEGAGDWGLMCRYVDIDNFYRVAIDSGAFAIYKVINNEYTYLTSPEWIEHEALNPDNFPNGQIPISLYCGGDQIQFMVNGSMLYHASDSDLPSGDVRMYAGSYETIGDVDGYYIKVLFDNFSITAP